MNISTFPIAVTVFSDAQPHCQQAAPMADQEPAAPWPPAVSGARAQRTVIERSASWRVRVLASAAPPAGAHASARNDIGHASARSKIVSTSMPSANTTDINGSLAADPIIKARNRRRPGDIVVANNHAKISIQARRELIVRKLT